MPKQISGRRMTATKESNVERQTSLRGFGAPKSGSDNFGLKLLETDEPAELSGTFWLLFGHEK